MPFNQTNHHHSLIRRAPVTLGLLLSLLLWFAPGLATASPPTDPPDLFTPVEEAGLQHQNDLPPHVLRARTVTVNLAELQPGSGELSTANAADALTLNLFDDTVFTATLSRIEPASTGAGYVWVGQVDGAPYSAVILVVKDSLMAGDIWLPDSVYQVRPLNARFHMARQINPAAFSENTNDAVLPPNPTTPQNRNDTPVEAQQDDGSIIDVMVAYTPQALAEVGSKANMLLEIYAAIAATHVAFANSGVILRLRLVHTVEVNYNDSGDILLDIQRLQATDDGYMDNIHVLRDAYNADLVSLFVAQGDSGGRGYILPELDPWYDNFGFSVVRVAGATSNLTLAHELGHNLGGHHDWYVEDGPGLFNYSHGVVNTGNRWQTVMAYGNLCADVLPPFTFCSKIPFFSNPAVPWQGIPTGVSLGTNLSCTAGNVNNPACDADNAQTLNQAALTVANYRVSDPALAKPVLSITQTVALANDPPSPGEVVTYTIVIANDGGRADNVLVGDVLPQGITGSNLLQAVAITANQSVTFSIIANVAANAGPGATITNTAFYTHASGTGRADAAFTTIVYNTYLPLVLNPACVGGEADNFADAKEICSGQTVSGQVNNVDLRDYYKIQVEAGKRLTINLTGSGGDADLYLYPPTGGGSVAASYNNGNNESITFYPQISGYWYIFVFSYSGWTGDPAVTNYNLTANLQ